MTTFAIKITDKNGNNAHNFLNVTRLDYNWSGQVKSWAVVSAPDGTLRGTPRFFDFGRCIHGLVIYGWMDTWDEVMAVRDLLNGKSGDSGNNWWAQREDRFYVSASDYHKGMVADFKAYCDRMQGGEKAIKYTLTFVIADKFSSALP